MGELFFQVLKNLVVRARVSCCLPRAEMLRWSQSALLATAMGQENVYLCFDKVKMAKVLTGIHERAGFPGLKRLFSSANGYLVHHSPKDIFDVTIAFLVPENVDFGILYAILLTFWIKLYVLLC